MACRSQSGQEYVPLHLSKNRRYAETEIPEREKLSGIFFFYKNIFDSVIAALSGRMT